MRPGSVRFGLPRVRILVGEPIEVKRREPTPDAERMLMMQLEQSIEELRGPFGPPAHVWIDEA